MPESRTRRVIRLFALCLLFAVCFAGPSLASAQALNGQARQIIGAIDLKGADVSAYAVDLSNGSVLVSIDPDEPMAPASNMKVVTTAAALKILGPEFHFRTELRSAGNGSILIVKGDGDPSFADPKILKANGMDVEQLLQIMVDAVKKANITKLDRVVVDDRIFEASGVHPGWKSKDLGDWFSAPVAGFNFFDNCLDFYPTVVNGRVEIRTAPAMPASTFTNKVTYIKNGKDSFSAVRKQGLNEWICSGVIEGTHTTPASAPVADAPEFFATVLAQRLVAAGIPVRASGKVDPAEKLPEGKVILPIETPIEIAMARCNKDSINLFAEAFLKRVGHKVTGQPGSWDNGSAAIESYLRQTVGEKTAGYARIADGSGLCKDNRLTTRILVGVLQAMNSEPKYAKLFRDTLSVGGEDGDGTLRRAGRFKNVNGQVYAKTGYIAGASTLSGYLVQANGKVIAYSVLCYNAKGGIVPGDCKAIQDRIVQLLDKSTSADPASSQKSAAPVGKRIARQ